MEAKSYRIVHKESGVVKHVGKHIYDNKSLLSQMDFMQQDVDSIIEENDFKHEEIENDVFNTLQLGEKIPELGEIAPKKAGRPAKLK